MHTDCLHIFYSSGIKAEGGSSHSHNPRLHIRFRSNDKDEMSEKKTERERGEREKVEKIEKDQKRVKAFPDRCEFKRQKQDRKSVTNGRRPTCRVNRRWYAHALPKEKKEKNTRARTHCHG